ncbi:MAG: hypothetical protein V3V08_02190 [Nannocystaceae bacterium]
MMTRDMFALGLLFGLGSCVMGYRGEETFAETHDAGPMRSLLLDLPATDVNLDGVAGATSLGWEGSWFSTGGTQKIATQNAQRPDFFYSRLDGVAELRAFVPLDVENLVDLELRRILVPADVDIELTGVHPKVDITGVDGHLFVDLQRGDVTINGSETGNYVRTGLGSITVTSSAAIDAATRWGDIVLDQTVSGGDVIATAGNGSIEVLFADVSNVSFQIDTGGRVDIRTADLVQVSSGQLVRELGDGTVRVILEASGDVIVRDQAWTDAGD